MAAAGTDTSVKKIRVAMKQGIFFMWDAPLLVGEYYEGLDKCFPYE
jgi:hypothetical protein